jgi:hypothetical protein
LSREVERVTPAPVQYATRMPPPPLVVPVVAFQLLPLAALAEASPGALPLPAMYSTVPSALAMLVGVPGKSVRPTVASGREPSPARRTMTLAALLRALPMPVGRALKQGRRRKRPSSLRERVAPVVALGHAGTTQSLSPWGWGASVVPQEDTPARSVSVR